MSAASPVGEPIAPDLLATRVSGVNLMPGTLADQLGDGTTLLVFLRHFGCIFCRETVSDLRAAAAKSDPFPRILFFFQGSPTEGRAFLRRYWPEARAVSDPERSFYAAFGLERGGVRKMFAPGVWAAQRRAKAKGLSNGRRTADIWMMPGIFVVQERRVVWAHEFQHAGDHPDFERIPDLCGCEVTP